jgi:hypothetical protein
VDDEAEVTVNPKRRLKGIQEAAGSEDDEEENKRQGSSIQRTVRLMQH